MSQATIDQLADNVPTAEVYQHPIHRLRVALITGQLASSIMLLLMMAVSLVSGDGAFYPLRVIGSMALGDRAMTGDGTFPIAIGLLLNQFALTLVWSVAFWAVLEALHVRDRGKLALMGLGLGVVSQILDVNILMGPVMTALHGHNIYAEHVPPAMSWVAHLVFGASFACYPGIQRYLDSS
ncbi:MAG: hypothetical protein IPK60_06935 [Sandaracinaceae bacterium]|nr:hypothetical protein [Sandaracinaceae bacterium]